jgi:hypothetical protein
VEARPVDRGGEDAERLLAALGVENHQSEFDWEKEYGFVVPRCSGWDVESRIALRFCYPLSPPTEGSFFDYRKAGRSRPCGDSASGSVPGLV